jgi:hypothetical protein
MDLQALGPEARRRVIQAVRKGTAVEDPVEARAAVAHARWGPVGPQLRAASRLSTRSRRWAAMAILEVRGSSSTWSGSTR